MRFEIQGVDLSANTLSIIGDVTPLLTAGVKFDVIESITFALLENNFTVSTDSTVTGGLTTVHVVESLTGTQLDPAIRSSSTPMLLIVGHYVIDFSDSSKPQLIIHPYTVDVTSTSLTLPGRGTLNYGEIVTENLLHDLEHFASPISPDFPVDGQIWFNSTQNMLYVYYNGSWKSLNVVFAESAPPSPETVGQLWYDTSAIQDRPQLMVYDGTTWRSVAANFGFSTISIGTDSGYTWGTVNTNTNQTADTNADTVTFVAGAGINLYTNTVAATDAIKIEHVDTSSQASTTGLTGSSVFSGIGLDTFGHVTTLTTRNLTAADVGAPSTTTFDTYARRYEIVGGTFGMPDAGVVVARFVAATNISIPALNTGGSIAVAGVTATNPAVFDIQKNGVSFANLTFATSSTTGAFDTGTTTLAPGDILTVVAPGTQDATLADIAFTIVGSLI